MKKVIGFYNSLEAHLLVISLAFTTLLIFVQVVMRYVFNNSLSWSEELARYVFIWQIWLGHQRVYEGQRPYPHGYAV